MLNLENFLVDVVSSIFDEKISRKKIQYVQKAYFQAKAIYISLDHEIQQ